MSKVEQREHWRIKAWLVEQVYVKNKMQTKLAKKLQMNSGSLICSHIVQFIEYWDGTDVKSRAIYGEARKHIALKALQNFKDEGHRPKAIKIWPAVNVQDKQYHRARQEHAYRLRHIDKLKLELIGKRLGVSRSRASVMIDKRWYEIRKEVSRMLHRDHTD